MAYQSYYFGSYGKSFPVLANTAALYLTTNSLRSSTSSSVSYLTPFACLTASMISSNGSISSFVYGLRFKTMSLNI